jgi:choline dehydrogenase-like flavoprotein
VDCVVGSGPSGVACAAALLRRGRRVSMLDVGLQLEPDRAARIDELNRLQPEEWTEPQARWLSEQAGSQRVPLKLAFGSDYPYRESAEHLGLSSAGTGLKSSFAMGGLSTVWGAAMLPNVEEDCADWPFTTERLKPHYEACLKLTGISAEAGDLDSKLPLHTDPAGHLKLSRQASAMERMLERNGTALRDGGIHFGRSRLAVRAKRGPDDAGCVYCGMCLNGCPYGYIYSSGRTVTAFRGTEGFTYQPDTVVTAVEERSDHVVVHAYHRLTRAPVSITADRVFLACGVVATSGILLRSMSAYGRTLSVQDSQYFLLPAALAARVSSVSAERLHTLSQLFIEIMDPQVSPHTVHLQVYSFNSLIGRTVRNTLGRLRSIEALAREIEGRLLILQGYIHSSHSSQLALTLLGRPGLDRLELGPIINPEAREVVRKVVRKLRNNSLRLGAFPLSMLMEFAEPGRGFHAGGTMPMRRNPAAFETDVLGRPKGFQRVHAVDSTVLPSIAATTVTLTVMANAHRIASEAGTLG